jgi:hypothetical protein
MYATALANDPAGAEEDWRSYDRLGGRDLPAYEESWALRIGNSRTI